MFKVDMSDFDDLDELLADEISVDIKKMGKGAALAASGYSELVLTGRFKGNWVASNGEESSKYNEDKFDKSGATVGQEMLAEIDQFDLKKDDSLNIQNNTPYAETVGFDKTGAKAEKLLTNMIASSMGSVE